MVSYLTTSRRVWGPLFAILVGCTLSGSAGAIDVEGPFTVAWDAASGPVADYVAQVNLNGTDSSLSMAAQKLAFPDAVAGESYAVRVRARDADGNVGPWSDWSERINVRGPDNSTQEPPPVPPLLGSPGAFLIAPCAKLPDGTWDCTQ